MQQKNEQQQADNAQHVETLNMMLGKLGTFQFANEESRTKLQAALEAGAKALEEKEEADKPKETGGSGGGLDLSDSAMDFLAKHVSGEADRATAKAERDREGVLKLAALVDQVPHSEAETSPAVSALARLVRNEG